nr:probable RNA-dependent RNA polymerase 1 [Tanacetum cinerariifolium]
MDLVQKPRHYALETNGVTLHFGCQVSKQVLSVLYTMRNASVKFGFGARKLYFGVTEPRASYKLQLSYENIWQVQLHRPRGLNSSFLVIQLFGAPRIFQKVENNMFSFYREEPDDQWVRATDFTSSASIGQSSHLCLELSRDVDLNLDCCYEPVKWITEEYRKNSRLRAPAISLDPDAGLVYVRRVQITPSKVYFCGPEINVVNAASIREWMGDFSRIKNVAKYAARLGQSFGSSKESLSVAQYEVEKISDVEIIRNGTKYVFSDGIGKISKAFAQRVSKKCGYGFTPSAFQIRYAGYKGVVAVDPTSVMKLSLRNSMSKFESDNTKLDILAIIFRAAKLLEIRTKTRIFVPKGRSMMGCLDETGTLEYGEVFVQFSGAGKRPLSDDHSGFGSNKLKIVRGKVVVAKNPCLHPGDVRVLKSVDIPALHHMVDCVVFPQKGQRPHPNECSGSDLDGDIYFVCWDPNLIPPRHSLLLLPGKLWVVCIPQIIGRLVGYFVGLDFLPYPMLCT